MPKTTTTKKASTTKPKKAVKKPVSVRPVKKAAPTTRKTGNKKAGIPAQRSEAAATGRTRKTDWGEVNEHGFREGTESATIANLLLEGATTRRDLNNLIRESLASTTTRNGTTKNVPSLVSGVIKRLQEKGYTVESTWRLVPPTTPVNTKSKRSRRIESDAPVTTDAPVKTTKAKTGVAKKSGTKRPTRKAVRK